MNDEKKYGDSTLGQIKQSPRQCGVEEVEDMVDEIERLTVALASAQKTLLDEFAMAALPALSDSFKNEGALVMAEVAFWVAKKCLHIRALPENKL